MESKALKMSDFSKTIATRIGKIEYNSFKFNDQISNLKTNDIIDEIIIKDEYVKVIAKRQIVSSNEILLTIAYESTAEASKEKNLTSKYDESNIRENIGFFVDIILTRVSVLISNITSVCLSIPVVTLPKFINK